MSHQWDLPEQILSFSLDRYFHVTALSLHLMSDNETFISNGVWLSAAINVRNLTFRVRGQKLLHNLLSFANCWEKICLKQILVVVQDWWLLPKIVFNAPWWKYSRRALNLSLWEIQVRQWDLYQRWPLTVHNFTLRVKTCSEFTFC